MKAAQCEANQPGVRVGAMRTTPPSHPLSLFIIGPSRSGKTTVERLLGQVEGIKCGYESRLAERTARRTSQLSGLLTIRNPADLPTGTRWPISERSTRKRSRISRAERGSSLTLIQR